MNNTNEWQECTDEENDYFAALEAAEEDEEDDRGFLRAYDELNGYGHRNG